MKLGHIPGIVRTPFEQLVDLLPAEGTVLVTDAYLAGLPRVRAVFDALEDSVEIVVPVGEPTTNTVDAVSERITLGAGSVVVAFGGGSVIDTAKLASLATAENGPAVRHLGVTEQSGSHGIDVVAVPTTSGSGAEVTRTAVVTRDGRKTWAWSEALRPTRVLVDPTLTHGLSVSATVATGLDALVHGLEAATAPNADAEAIESGEAAISVIFDALPVAVSSGSDAAARADMLDASICAGFAIDRSGTGIGHAVGHAIASIVPIPHGLAVAFGMRTCLDWGIDGAPDAYRRVDPRSDIPDRIDRLFDLIGFWSELDRWAIRPLEVAEFHLELVRDEHRPMILNSARTVGDDDPAVVAALVSSAWNARSS